MIITAFDVSYSSLGLASFNTYDNTILTKTIKFHSPSSLNKKDIEEFHNINHSELDKKEVEEYWKNIRLSKLYKEMKIYSSFSDVIISEKQFSEVSEVYALTRLCSVHEGRLNVFKSYYPSNWRKLLFKRGSFGKEFDIKSFTRDKMNDWLSKNNIDYQFLNSFDESDAFALVLTFLIDSGIIDKDSNLDYQISDLNKYIKVSKKKKK